MGSRIHSIDVYDPPQVEGGGEDLKVFFLTRNGRIFIFQVSVL
jgi:hypothetical protein